MTIAQAVSHYAETEVEMLARREWRELRERERWIDARLEELQLFFRVAESLAEDQEPMEERD